MLRHNRSYRYIDHLQDLVRNYNRHKSLYGLSPKQITKQNETYMWAKMYLKPKKFPKTPPRFKFKAGDFVRISNMKQPFRRAYQQQFTSEIFKIVYRQSKQGILF